MKHPGLESCLKALRDGDILVVWKLDRLGRSLQHLVNIVQKLTDKNIGLKVITGKGADIDTTTPTGKLVFGFFAVLAEFERDLILREPKQIRNLHVLEVKKVVVNSYYRKLR